ncbi:MAG: hydantoinase/oxoprolinase family protein [Candidatus Bathyarchaeia archaeon]
MRSINVVGLDIGGANTKISFLSVENGVIRTVKVMSQYFPVWKRKDELPFMLKRLKARINSLERVDSVGVTMTAELSDAYRTKKEGVDHILESVKEAFHDVKILVLDVEANLLSPEEARRVHLKVASANWVATGWMISKLLPNCIIIDVGSTTTSIIPVINGKIAAEGKNDLEKLINGELVYSGALRTNIAAIVNSVPIKGSMARVSSELFATSGDVHLILGNIREEDYVTETADSRGKSRAEALARLARIICADANMLNEGEIVEVARYIYERQIDQISCGLRQVYERIKSKLEPNFPVVVTGLGRNFLACKAASAVGLKNIIDLGEVLGSEVALATPSVGVAVMVASKLQGGDIIWKMS